MAQTSSNKKRNYTSPQKTQTSIVGFQKKLNNNTTPPRTAINHSLIAITASQVPSTPPSKSPLSNNPYRLLVEQGEPLELSEETSQRITNRDTDPKGSETSALPAPMDGFSSTEKVLLSRKAQHALRKIRSIRKVLMDNSIWEELEAVYGAGCVDPIAQDILKGSDTSAELLSPDSDADMMDYEDDAEPQDLDDLVNKSSGEETDSLKTSGLPRTQEQTERPSKGKTLLSATAISKTTIPSAPGGLVAPKIVSFAEAAAGTSNSHSLQGGNLPNSQKQIPDNPYTKKLDEGTIFP
jgi:hypothetical protein